METTVHEETYKGYTIKIIPDDSASSPDKWKNDDAFIVYDHNQFFVERKGFDPDEIFEVFSNKKLMYDGYHIFPLYAYIHSGVSLSLARSNAGWYHGAWDTSFKGFVLVKKEKGWSYRRDKAEKVAKSIVNEWNEYLSGNVYGYVVEDEKGNDVDSVWGYYGDYEKRALEEARSTVDYTVKNKILTHIKQLKEQIKKRVPLIFRAPALRRIA